MITVEFRSGTNKHNVPQKSMKRLFIMIMLFLGSIGVQAQQVDTVSVYSPAMNREVKNVIILPSGYDSSTTEYPVVYLLHGYGDNHQSWLTIQPELPELASRYGMILVCPDGSNSWYWDSPVNPEIRYETYVSSELIPYIDTHYKTIRDKSGRAITGLSMGGHGAMWLAIRHQDTFGACGSTSGGVDIRPFPEEWEIKDLLGEYYTNGERWDEYTVMNQLYKIRPGLAIIIDCGTEDFFYGVNEKLHRELCYRNIKHDYISRPGIHDYPYWRLSITYQLQFFSDFFNGLNTYEVKLIYSQD